MPECPECGFRTRSAIDYCPYDGTRLERNPELTDQENDDG